MAANELKYPLDVVFDGNNEASSLEVNHLKEKDADNNLNLVDVSQGANAEDYGCDIAEVKKTVHVRDAGGTVLGGKEAISALHDAVGLGNYFRFCRQPGLQTEGSGFFRV